MEPENVFKLAAAAVEVAEILGDHIEEFGDAAFEDNWEVLDKLDTYQHIRDRG